MTSYRICASLVSAVFVLALSGAVSAKGADAILDCDTDKIECDTPETVAKTVGDEGYQSPGDYDDDTILDAEDNCPFDFNDTQRDVDRDSIGDECDNCPNVDNKDQSDIDEDAIGDKCDNDADGDGVLNGNDNCPSAFNKDQSDIDEDAIGDACDEDVDGDGVDNLSDACPFGADTDTDTDTGECNRDWDGDGVQNFDLSGSAPALGDNCPTATNPGQEDVDSDGVGDECDPDLDGDGVFNSADNCPAEYNSDQDDLDRDGIGSACDKRFCYAVSGDVDHCLDPAKPFEVYSPNVLDAEIGNEIRLRLFANRQNSGLRYRWDVVDGPYEGTRKIENAFGTVSLSTPFEYRYPNDREPTFVPSYRGTYTLRIAVEQAFDDEVTGEAGLTAEAYSVIEVKGEEPGGGGDCSCFAIGNGHGASGFSAIFLLIALLACAASRKRP